MRFDNLLSDEAALGELGRRLTQVRLARGWTQANLASAAAVSKRTVERVEAGESIQLGNLIRCLRALARLDGFELLLPETPASPIDLLERHGRRPQRVRARRGARPGVAPGARTGAGPGTGIAAPTEPQTGVAERDAPWTWGDET